MRKFSKQKSLQDWFVHNDTMFGMSLMRMRSKEEVGTAMQARYGSYGFDMEGLEPDDEAGLLERLNGLAGEEG